MVVAYRIEAGGFSDYFTDVAAMQQWLDALKRANSWIVGKTCNIYRGEKIGADSYQFNGNSLIKSGVIS